jgi:hypothetical protein
MEIVLPGRGYLGVVLEGLLSVGWTPIRAPEGGRYFIYRVCNVETTPALRMFQDPARLERDGRLKLNAMTWLLKYE